MTIKSNEKRVIVLENRQQKSDIIPARWMTCAESDPIIEKEIIEQLAHPKETAAEERRLRMEGVPEWVFRVSAGRREKYINIFKEC